MKTIRSDEEIQSIREACQIAATVLKQLVDAVGEGMTTYDLDQLGRKAIEALGLKALVTIIVTANTSSLLIPAFLLMKKSCMVLVTCAAPFRVATLFPSM